MNAHAEIRNPLDKLRAPFPANQVSKLPKETRKQIDERKNRVQGCMVWDCPDCGNAHHKNAVHLDYVGHAAATDRLLDTDIEWSWEPMAVDQRGLPAFDETGGLWIKLTVCGVTRIGYGSADGKTGGDAKKEIIGDAIRNAGMRFGMALDLWHKGDLHVADDKEPETSGEQIDLITPEQEIMLEDKMREAGVDPVKFLAPSGAKRAADLPSAHFANAMKSLNARIQKRAAQQQAAQQRAAQHIGAAGKSGEFADIDDDSIPY